AGHARAPVASEALAGAGAGAGVARRTGQGAMSGFVTPRPSSSGTHATRITKTFHHSAGAAIVAATATSQWRSVRAPNATTTRAITRRIGSEIWIAAGGTSI